MRNSATQCASPSKGIILLIVLGILALMSVLGVTFVSMSRLERAVSQNYVDHVRARMVAESGVEGAIHSVNSIESGVLTSEEMNRLLYYPHYEFNPQESSSIPPELEDADDPSLDVNNMVLGDGISNSVSSSYVADGDYYKLRIVDESGKFNINDSPGVGVPQRMYDILRSIATVLFNDSFTGDLVAEAICTRRDDLGGRFHSLEEAHDAVTNPTSDTPILTDEEWRAMAAHITIHSWIDDSVIEPTFAIDQIDNANPTIQIPDGIPDFKIKISRGGDPILIPSFPVNQPFFNANPGGPRVDWDDASVLESGRIYLYLDAQTSHFKKAARAPVNINTCKKALLKALLEPVRGWYLEEEPENWSRGSFKTIAATPEWMLGKIDSFIGMHWPSRFMYYDLDASVTIPTERDTDPIYPVERAIGNNSSFGIMKETIPFVDDPDDPSSILDPTNLVSQVADKIWQRIHVGLDWNGDGSVDEDPKPFTQWQEFGNFVRSLVDDPDSEDLITANIPNFDYFQADAVISNFNPNSNINDYNPDSIIYRHVDKSQLTGFSTEFAFEPTGTFTIQSMGFVTDLSGQKLVSVSLDTVIRTFEFMRISTQSQFLDGYTGDSPDPDTLYFDTLATTRNGSFSESDGFYATAGANFQSDGNVDLTGRAGYSLMSYPEPITVKPNLTDPDHPVWNPPAWHGPDASKNESGPSGADEGWTPADGYFDEDWNYIDDSHYDGYLGLATYSLESTDYSSDLVGMVNFEKTLHPLKLQSNASKEMIKGYHMATRMPNTTNVHPQYPAVTFTTSPFQVYNWMTTRHGNAGLGAMIGVVFADGFAAGLMQQPTPQTFPTIDRLTYPYPEDPTRVEQRRIPGVLHPDGGLSDAGRTISFHGANIGNTGSNKGTNTRIHFWLKPNFDPALGSRIRTIMNPNQQFLGMFGSSSDPSGYGRANQENIWELTYFPRRGPFYDSSGDANFADHTYNNSDVWWNPDVIGHRWAPACSFQMAIYKYKSNHLTVTGGWRLSGMTNHSFPGSTYQSTPDESNHLFNFEFHKWNHIGVSWRAGLNSGQPRISLNINGQACNRNGYWNSSVWGNYINLQNDSHNGFWPPNENIPPDGFNPAPPRGITSAGDVYWAPSDIFEFVTPPPTGTGFQLDFKNHCASVYGGDISARVIGNSKNYVRMGSAASDGQRNYVADSTYDEVCTYRQRSFSNNAENNYLDDFYKDGRYFGGSMVSGDAGFYTSPEIDVFKALNLSGVKTITPRSISWTLYWPMKNGYQFESGNRSSVNANVFTDLQSTSLNPTDRPNDWLVNADWDPIAADIYTTSSEWIFGGDDTDFYNDYETMATCAAGSIVSHQPNGKAVRVNRNAGDTFRYRLYFNIAPGEDIYETPILDDVTITFTRPKPVVLSYTFS